MAFVTEASAQDIQEQRRVKEVLDWMGRRNKKKFWRIKRIIDICIAIGGILLFSVPMLIIVSVIFISQPSKSPIYAQDRMGRHGKVFKLYKFRTMVPGADKMVEDLKKYNEMDGPVFKIKEDPRITKFGGFLRRTSLDELPQFFNVIKGDMAVIGPRPPIPREVEQYTEYQKLHLTVTPGITCLWQVQPNRNDLSFDEWVNLDITYILNRTIWLDIQIMFKTAWVMFRGEGR